MLNLRDPKITTHPTEGDNDAYGSPSSTEPMALTAVVMSDVTTFQTGAEGQPNGEFLTFTAVIPKSMYHFLGSPDIEVVPRG